MKDIKVRFNYDMSTFEENVKKLIDDIQSETVELIKNAAVVFANAAAKWTPPRKNGSPSMTIEKEKYLRPYYVLSVLIQGGYEGVGASEIDKAQFKNGMKFKILNTKHNRQKNAPAYAYCKTKGELNRLRKIKNRGLAKAMWGKSLDSIGMNVPIGIQRLLNKSPNLESLPYSHTELEKEEDSVAVTIENRAENIEKYAKPAEAYGYKKVQQELRHRLAALARKERKL